MLWGADKVGVIVDQPRDHGLLLEVDHPGAAPLALEHVGIVADGNDALAPDRDALKDGETVVQRYDLAVEENGVGGVGCVSRQHQAAPHCRKDIRRFCHGSSRRESEALSPTSGGMPTPGADAAERNAISPYRYRPTAMTDLGLDPAATVEGDRGVNTPFRP